MGRSGFRGFLCISVALWISGAVYESSFAWNDKTHIAIAKAAGYEPYYNVTGPDMAKIKAGDTEAHNHYVNNPPGTRLTPDAVLAQVDRYDQVEEDGHLYGAIIASLRKYRAENQETKTRAYHLAFCAHYVGDLSQPLHNILYNSFNRSYHAEFDAVVEDEVLDNLHRIEVYPITITSERDLAREIARIAKLAMHMGYRLESEGRTISKDEAYSQLGHSVSLLKATLEYIEVD